MNQLEAFGEPPAPLLAAMPPINAQRAVKDEREALRDQLKAMLTTAPSRVRNGSVQMVQSFRAAIEAAGKVARSDRSSGRELRAAISSLQQFG